MRMTNPFLSSGWVKATFAFFTIQMMFLSSAAVAQENMGEGLVAAVFITGSSWLASEDPDAYGWGAGVANPLILGLGAKEGGLTPTDIAIFVGAESVAVYNGAFVNDDISEGQIFRKNLVAWGLVGVIAAGTSLFFQREEPNRKAAFFIQPEKGGASLQFVRQF